MKEIIINVRKVKESIRYSNGTWAFWASHYGCHPETVRKKVRESYVGKSKSAQYKELCAKEKANVAALAAAANILAPFASGDHVVIVTETGYMMTKGMEDILGSNLEVVIPRFCLFELDKLSRESSVASEILKLIRSKPDRFEPIKLENEILFEDPQPGLKKRTSGIVALCCELWSQGIKVRLLTTSFEVAELAKAQGFGSDVSIELQPSTTRNSWTANPA